MITRDCAPVPPDAAILRLDANAAWQRVGAMRATLALLATDGADTDGLLASAGLTREKVDDPDGRVPMEQYCRFYAESAAATGRADFGLRAGAAWHLDDLGALAVLMRSASTLGEALRLHARFQFLNSQALVSVVLRRGDVAEWNGLVLQPPVPGFDHMLDHMTAAGLNFLRGLVGHAAVPIAVEIAHRRPADVAPYRHHFATEVIFDAPVSLIRFPATLLDLRLPGSDPARLRDLLDHARRAEPKDIVLRAQRAIAMQIRQGDASVDAVAAELGRHRRTLGRRLAEQGTTLQAMVDAARMVMAQQMLTFTQAPLDTIAAVLGYAGSAPFVRAFTRWSGVTPGRWRTALAPGSIARLP